MTKKGKKTKLEQVSINSNKHAHKHCGTHGILQLMDYLEIIPFSWNWFRNSQAYFLKKKKKNHLQCKH